MKFFDPFPVTCEHCQHKSQYPVDKLLRGETYCQRCREMLRETPTTMRASVRSHRIDIWPALFWWEAYEAFSIDLDLVSDEEDEAVQTVSDFLELAKKYGQVKHNSLIEFEQVILSMNIMRGLQPLLSKPVSEYRLEELAQLSGKLP